MNRSLNFQMGCLAAGLSLLLMSCSSSEAKFPTPATPVAETNASFQSLPITAQMQIGGKTIQLEVARTSEQQRIGLMNRTSLADDRGMLFPFNPPRPTMFWMKNTLIPLDMVFVRNGVVKSISANVPPCKADPCPTYGSPTVDIDQVIELRGGRARELGLKPGDRISVKFSSDNTVKKF